MSTIIRIALEIIKLSKSKLEKNYKVTKLLKEFNLVELKNDFNSVYAHTLVRFGVDKNTLIVELFADKNIVNVFKTELYDKESGEFKNEIIYNYYHGKPDLKREFPDFKVIEEEIDIFREKFKNITNRSRTPSELELYNKVNYLEQREYERSFEYQVEQYLKRLVDDFRKEFLEQDHYIDLNGEIVIKKRESYEPGEKLAEKEKEKIEKIKYEPIDKYLNQWINDKSQNFLAVMGEYGTGKTTLCRHIIHGLADDFLGQNTDDNNILKDEDRRIPLLFNLRNFKQEEVDDFVVSQLNKNGIEDINYNKFLQKLENNEFIILVDGFDEMAHKIDTDEKRSNFYQIEKLIESSKKTKIILTSREEYFTYDEEINKVFKHAGKSNYKIINLLLFDDIQIKKYLETHTDNADFYLRNIKDISDLEELASRPVLLSLIIENLIDLLNQKRKGEKIKAADLYKNCIEKAVEKKSADLRPIFRILPVPKRLHLLQNLAVWMFENDTFNVDVRHIVETLDLKIFFDTNDQWEIIKFLNNFLTFTFLTREHEADNIFRISHKSFRDYLCAQSFVSEINTGSIKNFARKITTSEINNFIAEQNPDKNNLFKFITNAKNLPEERIWQGTNSANILLQIDQDTLKGRDLSDCQLSFVNFIGCNLTKTVFDNSVLSNCKFNITLLSAYYNNAYFGNSFLELSSNQIENIEYLKELKNLEYLDLSSNKIENIETLKELKNLEYLNLSSNKIENIECLKELKNLEYLDLSSNKIENIETLKELKILEYLNLSSNKIENIECLKDLKNLEYLNLGFNQIENIEYLKDLKNLEMLYLVSNKIENIEYLKDLKNLEFLDLSSNKIENIEYLKDLKNLKDLYLSFNKIENIECLKDFKNLYSLDLSSNKIENFEYLKELKNLVMLYLVFNKIENIECLKELKNLEILDLSSNKIENIEYLKELKNLVYLNLSSNKIENIEYLKDLKNLKDLYLKVDKIPDNEIIKLEKSLPNCRISYK